MMKALLSKNKFKFVDGSIQEPQKSDQLHDAWVRCNTMILSWITKFVSEQIAQSVIYINNAQRLWEDLKEIFSKGDYFRFSDLLQEIHSINQADRTISSYFTELKILWEELESLRPTPTCTCDVRCSCDLSTKVKDYKDIEYVICFLKGLNDQYNTVKSQILIMDPLPVINKVFSLVLQQERQQNTPNLADSRIFSLNTQSGGNWRSPSNGRGGSSRGRGRTGGRGSFTNAGKVCTICGKENHTIDSCYFKHGFPPNFKFKNKGNSTSINTISSNPLEHTDWILDTGATDHVSNSLYFFTKYHPIDPVHVKLPNENTSTAQFSGTIIFSEKFFLNDVLYIPNFHLNIIYVQRIAASLDYELIFNKNSCTIQDLTSKKMIGFAEVKNHLYILQRPSKDNSISACKSNSVLNAQLKATTSSFDLWHYRLGHPSHVVLQIVKSHFPYVTYNKNITCDYCYFGKQARLPFPTSTSKSLSFFDLVHMDIWGPLAIPTIHGHKYFLTIVDDYSRHTWIYFMKSKGETRNLIQNFISYVQTQFTKHIKVIRSDNGVEFAMDQLYATYGIVHQTSCVETPQQNSIVERKHRRIRNITRTLLFHSNVPKSFWC
uniref:Retrovirus-related Pol polyprotein from transposon TNT 1-94 n=1 Tax=Cajanus cajan TaxID=3821 RepID=A0A151TF78_CAJCA|nr:Retrovirus-related Pol polyprotein from transposon TNT 1-94 [Cajanus cajan]